MSVVEEIKSGMCGKKISYESHDEAQEAYWEMCNKRNDTEHLVYYECLFCNRWHLGNERPGMAKRIAMVKEAKNESEDHETLTEDWPEGVRQERPESDLRVH